LDDERKFPQPGERLVIPLVSVDKREDFLLDITRSQINVAKITHQNRARHVVILMRLDIQGAPHRNPDGEVIPCPHLHIYRENFGDKMGLLIAGGQVSAPGRSLPNLRGLYDRVQRHRNT
jgi:hypothetical protein